MIVADQTTNKHQNQKIEIGVDQEPGHDLKTSSQNPKIVTGQDLEKDLKIDHKGLDLERGKGQGPEIDEGRVQGIEKDRDLGIEVDQDLGIDEDHVPGQNREEGNVLILDLEIKDARDHVGGTNPDRGHVVDATPDRGHVVDATQDRGHVGDDTQDRGRVHERDHVIDPGQGANLDQSPLIDLTRKNFQDLNLGRGMKDLKVLLCLRVKAIQVLLCGMLKKQRTMQIQYFKRVLVSFDLVLKSNMEKLSLRVALV